MNKPAFFLTLLISIPSISSAANMFIEGGLHFGGDTVATVVFVDGSSESVKAGQLLSGSIGLIADVNDSIEARTSIGIKFDGVLASNGDIDFTRFPLELMLFNKGESVSFGAGASYHIGPEFSSTGAAAGLNISFEDALGFVFEVDFKIGAKAYLGIKATSIDYDAEFPFTGSLSGNSVGLVIGARF